MSISGLVWESHAATKRHSLCSGQCSPHVRNHFYLSHSYCQQEESHFQLQKAKDGSIQEDTTMLLNSVVDTCLRSQVLSSVKVSLAHSQGLLMCFVTHQATRLWPSPLHPVAVCGTDPSHLKLVNAIQWPKSKLNQTVAKSMASFCPVMKHMLGNWHPGI